MEKVASKDGTTIAFDRTGEGPPVVVVGPAFSQRRYPDLVRLAELLGKRFTVANYDRRGRGDSGDTRPYAVQREVEDLGAVLGAAGRPATSSSSSCGRSSASPPEIMVQARKEPSWREQEALAHTLAYDTLLLGDGPLPAERAASVRAPTLVMEGSDSFPFMRGIASDLAGLIPGARARVLEGQGHDARPEVLAPVLEGFFAD